MGTRHPMKDLFAAFGVDDTAKLEAGQVYEPVRLTMDDLIAFQTAFEAAEARIAQLDPGQVLMYPVDHAKLRQFLANEGK